MRDASVEWARSAKSSWSCAAYICCVLALAVPACFRPNYDRPLCGPGDQCPAGLICVEHSTCSRCDPGAAGDGRCGADGTCEPNGSCSQADATCVSGRRYASDSGSLSGQCVTEIVTPIDASIDTPPDAQLCFGEDPFVVCLAAAPSAPLTLSAPTVLDTDSSTMCVATTSGGTGYCVIAGTTVTVEGEGRWRATGTKPLVLVASDSITVSATIDVSSHHTTNPLTNPEIGAGADYSVCAAPTTAPTSGGGGAGGNFTGFGGPGGASAKGGSAGGVAGTVSAAATLHGGCPGQDGEGAAADRGKGGHGGGSVMLIAVNAINITAGITAAGEGGRAGLQNTSGAGGGGAGGMIVLSGRTVMNSGLLLANGGAGGEGSGENTAGADGADSTTIAAATGGSVVVNGGDGGSGSAGVAAGAGAPGAVGTVVTNLRGGSGGGGGGAGLIKAPVGAGLGQMISPAATQP